MRVLRVSGGLDEAFGGPTMSTILSCLAIRQTGLDVVLAFPAPSERQPAVDALLHRLEDEGVRTRCFPLSRRFRGKARRWGLSGAFGRWILSSARTFDVVHVHGAWTYTTFSALLAAKVARRPIVLTPHESLTAFDVGESSLPIRLVKRALRAIYLRAFDLVVFASPIELEETPRAGRMNAIAVAHPVEIGPPVDREQRQGGLRLGYLGRIDPKKNLPLLLEALAATAPTTTLAVDGDGPPAQRQHLHALASGLELNGRVRWLGFVHHDDKAEFFGSIDLLVLPSRFECFGVAVAEALAAGVPAIVTSTTGLAPVVRHHECGLVITPNRRALLDALATVEAKPELIDTWSARARPAAEAELSLGRHGAVIREAYEELAA